MDVCSRGVVGVVGGWVLVTSVLASFQRVSLVL